MRSAATLTVVAAVALFAFAVSIPESADTAAFAFPDQKSSADAAKPVEDSMHEFMEYVFEPPYKRLKAAMAVEDKDRGTWKSIKSDSLILAEAGNLLLIRRAAEKPDVWTKHSVDVRELGAELYQAARKKDATAANRSYRAMLTRCNSCHDAFAEGEHQLQR